MSVQVVRRRKLLTLPRVVAVTVVVTAAVGLGSVVRYPIELVLVGVVPIVVGMAQQALP